MADVEGVGDVDDQHPGAGSSASERALHAMLAESHLSLASELPAMAQRYVAAFGGSDVRIFLADLQQLTLVPFVGHADVPADEVLEPLNIDGTVAGRAFQLVQLVVQSREGLDPVVWLPLLDGTERLGVLGVTVPGATPEIIVNEPPAPLLCRFASLLSELIMTKSLYGDTVVRLRRQRHMGLAAEMQWSLLPPLTVSSRAVTIAAALEPAYDVSGDTFDYAVDPGTAKAAVFDGMGHGLRSAQMVLLAVTAYRNARRAGLSLTETCKQIDEALLDAFSGSSFTTALFTELDTDTGVFSWVSAGHPPPLLIRQGRLIKALDTSPRAPLGMTLPRDAAHARELSVGTEQLEPGDCVLLYTDGVTEARASDGSFFGEDRLADLIVRHLAAGFPAAETMRRVVHALLVHQEGRLTDDASLALLQWQADVQAVAP
ncbi:MAG: PP2C family protein-serine/threonine phosphatase [Jatrophihabitans sp.]|uniref:PP2C family protein-serine/threonine phosphatase n=1 Tax=Jatrophihabitans sp. TaxID=1932789 RepID=UPI003910F55A